MKVFETWSSSLEKAFYGLRARGIKAADVDCEVTLEVGDVERE
jgi:hypothetical protein